MWGLREDVGGPDSAAGTSDREQRPCWELHLCPGRPRLCHGRPSSVSVEYVETGKAHRGPLRSCA